MISVVEKRMSVPIYYMYLETSHLVEMGSKAKP